MNFGETSIETVKSFDNYELEIHLWEPENPDKIIVAVHGALTHAGDWQLPAEYLKKKGIAIIAMDLRGHKQPKVHVESFEHYFRDTTTVVDWVKARHPEKPIYLLGHSMGSLIITHWGIKYHDPAVKGYIMSSPYYKNKVPINPLLIMMASFLSKVAPKFPVDAASITDHLTHDEEITRLHYENIDRGLRTGKLTARFGHEIQKAQKWIEPNIERWNQPVMFIVAGDEYLSDEKFTMAVIQKIDEKYKTVHYYPENFHENFNELNREEIYNQMYEWLQEH